MVGVSVVVGAIPLVLYMPLMGLVGAKQHKYQSLKQKYADARIKVRISIAYMCYRPHLYES